MCKGAVRIVCDSPNRTCTPLSDLPEPQGNARVLTLPAPLETVAATLRSTTRPPPGKSGAVCCRANPAICDVRGHTQRMYRQGSGSAPYRCFFRWEKDPDPSVIVQRGGRRTPCTPAPRSSSALSPKRKCERIFRGREGLRRSAETAGLRPRSAPLRFASPAPRSGRREWNGCPDFRSPSRKRPRSAIFSGRRRQVWNISLNFAGT